MVNMNILDLEFFVEVQYDIFKILSPNNIYRSLPFKSNEEYIFVNKINLFADERHENLSR